MKFLVVGDQFVKNEIFLQVFRNRFPQGEFITGPETGWPVEPYQHNEEIREFTGEPQAIISLIKDAQVLLIDTAPVTAQVVEAAQELKVICCTRGGPININEEACTKRGIPIIYSPGRNASAVVEFTLGLTLAHLKNIAVGHEGMKQKKWRSDYYAFENVGDELPSLTIGVIGFGHIGKGVAKAFSVLGSNVLIADPFVSASEVAQAGYRKVELETLLHESDVVTIHVRETPETIKMMGAREFGLMKKEAYFINTARGGLVDYDALAQALEQKEIKGAALDVFDPEPLRSDHPIYNLENVTLTPHLGGASITSAYRGVKTVAEQLRRFIGGEPVKFCANPSTLPLAQRFKGRAG